MRQRPRPVNPFPDIPDPFGYGQRAVDFLRSLKHPKSTLPGKAFQLDPWQEEIVRKIYGPRYLEDIYEPDPETGELILMHARGDRIITDVVILVPRGNRKTSLCGALALLHTMGPEAIEHGEVICAAVDREQAFKIFTEARKCIEAGDHNLWVKGQGNMRFDAANQIKLQEYKSRLNFPNGSYLYAMGADAEAEHGGTPVAAFIDEIHAHKNRKLWDVIDSSLAKTNHTLRVAITTAGRGQGSIGHEVVEDARKVLRGEVHNPNMVAFLYETPADADWRDEKVWSRANPGMKHGYPSYAYLRQKARKAETSPGNLDTFKMLHLNMWLDKSTSPFVDMAVYDRGAAPIDLEALAGLPCWLGVDLSVTTDLTAVVAAFRDGDDGYIVLPHFFCPGDNLQRRADHDGVPYPLWAEEEFIEPTPGNVVDYRAVAAHIRGLCETYKVQEIAFDKAYAQAVIGPLTDEGYPCIIMQQGWVTQSPALNILEAAIIAGKFQHGGHPVLRWHFENVAIHTDSAGNRTMHKGKSKDRIDGCYATWMAVARAAAGGGAERSIFDDPATTAQDLVW